MAASEKLAQEMGKVQVAASEPEVMAVKRAQHARNWICVAADSPVRLVVGPAPAVGLHMSAVAAIERANWTREAEPAEAVEALEPVEPEPARVVVGPDALVAQDAAASFAAGAGLAEQLAEHFVDSRAAAHIPLAASKGAVGIPAAGRPDHGGAARFHASFPKGRRVQDRHMVHVRKECCSRKWEPACAEAWVAACAEA